MKVCRDLDGLVKNCIEIEKGITVVENNTKIIIRPDFGIIYMNIDSTNNLQFLNFLESLKNKMTEVDHLYKPTNLYESHNCFTALKGTKAKSEILNKSVVVFDVDDINYSVSCYLRIFYVDFKIDTEDMKNARFTWFIRPMSDVINIAVSLTPANPTQILSVIYDTKNLIQTNNLLSDEVRGITAKDFTYCENLTSLIKDIKPKEYIEKNYKKCIKCDIEFSSESKLQKHRVENSCSEKNTTENEYTISIISESLKYPNAIINWNTNEYEIPVFHSIYGIQLEIMRNFTDIYQIFNLNYFYEITTYSVDADIVHDSTVCSKCKTPLYNMYYCVVDVNSLRGVAYCAVCMHLDKNCGNHLQLLNGRYSRRVCKMKHKNTLFDIISTIPILPHRKHHEYINLLQIFSKLWDSEKCEITQTHIEDTDLFYDNNSRIVLFSNLYTHRGLENYLENLEKINTIVTNPTAIYKIKYYSI